MKVINHATILIFCILGVFIYFSWFFFTSTSKLYLKQSDSEKNIEDSNWIGYTIESDSANIVILPASENFNFSDYDYIKFIFDTSTPQILNVEFSVMENIDSRNSISRNITLFYEIKNNVKEKEQFLPFNQFRIPLNNQLKYNLVKDYSAHIELSNVRKISIKNNSIANGDLSDLIVSAIVIKKRPSIIPFLILLLSLIYIVIIYFNNRKNTNSLILNEKDDNEKEYSEYKLLRNYLLNNYSEQLSIESVARETDIPYYKISKIIKENSGVSFNQYINRIRIDKAKKQLEQSDLQVSEIAWEVGFKNISHFNRVFKDIVQLAPLEYRNTVAKNEFDNI